LSTNLKLSQIVSKQFVEVFVMVIQQEQDRSYLPINSYGIVGDCHSAMLVAPDGAIDWGCLPDFDSPAIFCRLLDAQRGGFFQVSPADPALSGTQRYLRDSNVLQTFFSGESGELVLTDFMPVETLSAWSYRTLNNNTWVQQDGSRHCLVRLITCTQGTMAVTITLKVTPNYAADACAITLLPGYTDAVLTSREQYIGLKVIGASLLPSFSAHILNDEEGTQPVLRIQATLREGERLTLALGIGRSQQATRSLVMHNLPQRHFEVELAHTLHCWRTWLSDCHYNGPYQAWVQRSALALKLLSYAPTGAIVAAATTSLPETMGGIRNWDYRFTWLRDASFTLHALNQLHLTEETRAFTRWLLRLSYSEGDALQIMYGIRGEHVLPEQELGHLSGYGSSRPVRIGNDAAQQRPFDSFGEILDCISYYWGQGCFERYGEQPHGPLWHLMRTLIEYVCTHWQEPDCGIWETRHQLAHHVYSKVMCWVALDRGIRAAEQFHLEADLERWGQVREQIRADVLAHGYNTTIGSFTQTYDNSALDAATLLLPLVGFLPADDPRMRSTVERISEYLTDEQGFVYRYRSEDGLEGSEGTFLMCTFWLVDNLALQGRVDEARSLFERLLSSAGPLGLFSEEVDGQTGAALGNYPQAFTHIALINSAHTLQEAEQRKAAHVSGPLTAALRSMPQE
jgi:GH15 family glucan-1,4-alpha-glucosidase